MSDDTREEAMSRLGGHSKIEKLSEKLEEVTSRFNQLRDEHQETVDTLRAVRRIAKLNALRPGVKIWIVETPGLSWYSEIGKLQEPHGMVTIEGIGHDWCVIRQDSLPFTLFASTPDLPELLAEALNL